MKSLPLNFSPTEQSLSRYREHIFFLPSSQYRFPFSLTFVVLYFCCLDDRNIYSLLPFLIIFVEKPHLMKSLPLKLSPTEQSLSRYKEHIFFLPSSHYGFHFPSYLLCYASVAWFMTCEFQAYLTVVYQCTHTCMYKLLLEPLQNA